MKIGLILPGSIWYAPYVRIYTRILEKLQMAYDIISWNREGDDQPEGFQYNVQCSKGHSSASFFAYYGYIKYIKKTITTQHYDKLIVFGPQMTCMLSPFLLLKYRHKYIIDYRDLSIEQKPGFKQLFSLMLKFSDMNVISSPGFKRCLPDRKYYISHNFNIGTVLDAFNEQKNDEELPSGDIQLLTIGAIRDFSSNIEVVKALANRQGFKLRFVGKGTTAKLIKAYGEEHHINNIEFEGFYTKEDEPKYVKEATFLNIFYPRIITHDTALSNRFYLSLIYKRPMIVTQETTQGEYVEKYGVGIAITGCNDLADRMNRFLNDDYRQYTNRCNELLKTFIDEYYSFENAVISFVQSNS